MEAISQLDFQQKVRNVEKYLEFLMDTGLFSGVSRENMAALLACLRAQLETFPRGAYILHQGQELEKLPILVMGKLYIQKDDYWGNRSILGHVEAGEMFGEAFAAPRGGAVLNDVVAVEDSAVVFLDMHHLLTTCSQRCRFHEQVIQNLFVAVAEKNRKLVRKLELMSRRSTREKLLAYLSDEARRAGTPSFTIPFNRQQLADFLSVDRSAMSSELCKMREEGLLDFEKNRFVLHALPK